MGKGGGKGKGKGREWMPSGRSRGFGAYQLPQLCLAGNTMVALTKALYAFTYNKHFSKS